MTKADFQVLIEERIKLAAQTLADGKASTRDDVAEGKLDVFLAFRRTLQGKATARDLGMLDAINDSLQSLQILTSKETFLGRIEP
ncbi:hypothetical protein [Pseudomonas syringae]|uniref:hypothetical protein n=1 Tax=Pseudomonas syringae TaxID=317 RepID=UPI003F756B16